MEKHKIALQSAGDLTYCTVGLLNGDGNDDDDGDNDSDDYGDGDNGGNDNDDSDDGDDDDNDGDDGGNDDGDNDNEDCEVFCPWFEPHRRIHFTTSQQSTQLSILPRSVNE